MTEQSKGDLPVGTRVRMKATGRTGTIREVLEVHGRTLYGVIYDRTRPEESAPLVGERVDEFGSYVTGPAFDVLPS